MNDHPAPPVVSVVVIFLNEETFLEEAVESVLGQTYGDWELLLVDDGSTDRSPEIAKGYAAQSPDRIRYLDHPGHANRGASATRNLGVARARGRYVAFLDADDVWRPEKLAEQMAILKAHPRLGMVCGASEYWWSWADSEAEDVVVPVGGPQDVVVEPPGLSLALYPLGGGAAPCPSGLVLRRDVVEEVGGFVEHFRGPYQLYEDQAFLAKVYLSTPVYVASGCWDRYRQHPNSCVAEVTRAGRYHEVRQFFLEWLETYLAGRGSSMLGVESALARALDPYHRPRRARLRRALRQLGERSANLVSRLKR